MSRLQLLILWILAIAAGLFYFKSNDVPDAMSSKTKLEIGSDLVSGKAIDSIDSFKVKIASDSVTLSKQDGQWVVAEQDNFPANINAISRILEAIRNTKVAQGVAAADEYYDRFNLDPAAEDGKPDSITLMTGGKESATIYLGKTREATGGSSGTAGRFVSLSDDDSGVYIVPETFGFLNAQPDTWINKTLTPLEEGVIKMEVTAPNDPTFKPWTVSRKTVMDDFLIEGLDEKEETKTNVTGTLKNIFASANFIEMINEEEFKKRANEKGTRAVKATDSGGSTFLITITPEKKDESEEPKKDDPAAPIPAINYLVTIEVLNGPTKPEPLAADASVQEKAVFQQRVENLAELSASVNRMRRTYQGRYFVVNKASTGSLTKNRGEFIQPKVEKKKPTSVSTPPIGVPNQGGAKPKPRLPGTGSPPPGIARPKDTPKKPKIEAVTPPIQVPPIPGSQPAQPKKPAESEKPAEPQKPAETEKPADQ